MAKITIQADGTLCVPDTVDIPFLEGDGVGKEITPAMQRVADAAVKRAYSGHRSIRWISLPAGQSAYENYGTPLPESTLEELANHHVSIKGPLTTPVGGGFRSLNVAIRQGLDLYVCQRSSMRR